jgi:hypothetical protein
MYVLQKHFGARLHADLKGSPWFGNHPDKAALYIYGLAESHRWLTSVDYSSWDLNVHWVAQRDLWRAVAERYRWPEEAALLLFGYDTLADLWTPYLTFQERCGIQSSGSGIFSDMNSLLSALVTVDCATPEFGHLASPDGEAAVFGDNVVAHNPDGAARMAERALLRWGAVIRPSECLRSQSCVVFLRRLVSLKDSAMEPVVLSRFRNAVCPKEPLWPRECGRHWSITDPRAEARIAMALRAQTVELRMCVDDCFGSKRLGYEKLLDWWLEVVAPKRLLRLDLSDAELSRLYGRELEELTWVKRLRGFGDSGKLLL